MTGIIKDYQIDETEEGSWQGSVCSPVIKNTYIHNVLLWWFKENMQVSLRGFAGIVVYAGDFLCCFQYKEEAEMFYERLKHRMKHFGLEFEESKSSNSQIMRYVGKKHRIFQRRL